MSAATSGHLTRKLSGKARAIFGEMTAAFARGRALSSEEFAQLQRRHKTETLNPREARRLERAVLQWVEAHAIATERAPTNAHRDVATLRQHFDDPRVEDGCYLEASIHPDARAAALRAFAEGRIRTFLTHAMTRKDGGLDDPLDLVVKNAGLLRERGHYEVALTHAYKLMQPRNWPGPTLRWLFTLADPATLRACGEPIPPGDDFEVFRGGGSGAALSWSRDPLVAAWFAQRSPAQIIRRARLAARDVAVYFPRGVHVRLPWQSDRSDEFITMAALDSTPLDAAEAEPFMAQVEP